MSGLKDKLRKKKKKDDQLLSDGGEEEGVSNPVMDDEVLQTMTSGGESSPEVEAAEADALVKTLKTKRLRKKKELAEHLTSPKDDIAKEMQAAKRKSRQKIDETERLEQEETMEVADDGTLPMPEEGEEEVVQEILASPREEGEEAEESKIKKLRRKKEVVEETPIEMAGVGEEAPEEEEAAQETDVKEPAPEPEPRAPSPTPEPEAQETDRKTPRMASLRNKMKERLMKAKEEAVEEVKEEDKSLRRERRLQRDKKQTTRFDTSTGKYDEMEAEELEKWTEEKKRQREERKKRMAVPQKNVYMPSAEEAFDFFTRNWDPEPEEGEEEKEKADTEEKEKKEGEEKEGEEKKEGEEEEEAEPKPGKAEDEQPLIQKDEQIGDGYVVIGKADFPEPTEVAQKEEKLYFYPSVFEIPATDKVGKEMDVRRLEEEGFYVGTRPSISGWSQNRMEHRLLKEAESGSNSSRKWFGEDGKLLALPDPLRPTPSRPPLAEEVEPYIETEFRKALIREFDNRYIDGTTEGGGHYQLDVDINQIVFTHHHLFSREHVLAQRLTQLYEQYVIRHKKNMTSYLNEKLKALKNSAMHLQDHIATHRSEHSLSDRANYDKRLQDYKYEIKQTRLQKDREEKSDRGLLKNIIHTWKEIRAQRTLQRFTNTPVKLQVEKEEVDKEADLVEWNQQIEDEVEELRDEFEREHKHKLLSYEEDMAKYQKQVQAKKEAEKRLRKKRGRRGSKSSKASGASGSGLLDDYTEEQQRLDQETLDEPDLTQPEPPESHDEAAIREQVLTKAREIRRMPGEPKLTLELSKASTITPDGSCPAGEQRRRNDVSKCQIFVKVLFNHKEVSRTNLKTLTQDFRVNFGQIFNMKIVQWPESIAFAVYESIGLSTHLMTELCAPIPDTSVTVQSVQLEELDFSSDNRISHGHEGVGSGIPFTFGKKGEELMTLMTTGCLNFSIAWAVDEHGQPLVPPSTGGGQDSFFNQMKKMDPVAAIGASGVMDLKKLAEWFANSRLDPNDPNNADIVYMLRGRQGDMSHLTPAEYFRLEQLMEEFDLITDEEMMLNRRFQLLQLRDEEVHEFRNIKFVPPFEREIARDTFVDYERKKREEQKLKQLEDIESHRAAVKRFRQRIREQVMRRFRVQSHRKRWDDVVYEEAVPNIAMLGTSLLKLTERRAPLKPKRKERKKVTAQYIKGDEVKILININRAQNIPTRLPQQMGGLMVRELYRVPDGWVDHWTDHLDYILEKHTYEPVYHSLLRYEPETTTNVWRGAGTMTARGTTGGLTDRRKDLWSKTLVRPFIEVMFQHQTIRTSVADGPNPSFNEELEIPFKAPNDDYTPSNLQTVDDEIFLNLFDEVVVDIQEDDREKGTTLHQRIEKKWLGSIKIPFTTVYFNGKIDGTFRVDAPPVLLGYAHDDGFAEQDVVSVNQDRTLLSMYMTIEPPLTQPEPVKERFSTNEDEKLMVYADQWQAEMQAKFTPKREVKTFVTDVNFKSVFITRYFKAIKPPEELTNKGLSTEATTELVARYVSLIPFISDSVIFPGLCDIWNTCDQFMQMLSGDEEEHAVLLVNYFLSMGKSAWLICGMAIPEGPTAYVLTEESSGYWIWNPSSGDHYRTQDSNCPLQSIGCLVNGDNIWANIQQYDKPSQMMYNLNDTACWETIFTRRYPSPGLGSIQPDSLYYFRTDMDYVTELQEKIQSVLKNKIMDWRSRYITRWNRHCTQIMRKLLPVLEDNCGKSVGATHINELEQSFSSYKVSGFPINMPFTEMDPIIETVYSTGVHAQESSDVEFALAVYVRPYPNSVLSVWVYVASLMRMR